MYAQCDVNRNEYLLLKAFADHRNSGSALIVEDQKIVVKGKDGSTSLKKLSILKELHPIQVVKYVIAQSIQYESAFN